MNGEIIKQTLSMHDVAGRYGFEPNRAGFICCPFHQDKTASLKVYDEPGRGWHCFGCNKGGSVVDFVMHLFNLDYKQAIMRMSFDFGFASDWQDKDRENDIIKRKKERKKTKEKQRLIVNQLCELHCKLHNTIKTKPVWSDDWCNAIHKIDYVSHRIEVLNDSRRRWQSDH